MIGGHRLLWEAGGSSQRQAAGRPSRHRRRLPADTLARLLADARKRELSLPERTQSAPEQQASPKPRDDEAEPSTAINADTWDALAQQARRRVESAALALAAALAALSDAGTERDAAKAEMLARAIRSAREAMADATRSAEELDVCFVMAMLAGYA